MERDLTSISLMAYLKYSFDIEEGFSTPYPSSNMEVHTLSLTLDNMKVVRTYLANGILGETFAPSTLQESYSNYDHLLPMDSI